MPIDKGTDANDQPGPWVFAKAGIMRFFAERLVMPWIIGGAGIGLCLWASLKLLPWKQWICFLSVDDSLSANIWRWFVGVALAFAMGNIIFAVWSLSKPKTVPQASMVFGVFWGLAAGAGILDMIFYIFDKADQQAYALLSAFGGAFSGWLLGMYLTPQDNSEQLRFGRIGATLTAAFSGYGAKSLQGWLADSKHSQYRPYIFLGALSAVLSMAAVYNTRAYGSDGVQITIPDGIEGDCKVALGKNVCFVAAVTGPKDTSVTWAVIPDGCPGVSVANIDSTSGVLKALAPGSCKVLARSVENPRLSDVVNVTVTN